MGGITLTEFGTLIALKFQTSSRALNHDSVLAHQFNLVQCERDKVLLKCTVAVKRELYQLFYWQNLAMLKPNYS